MTDAEIISEYISGNFSNFSKLVELTFTFAFSVAFRLLGDEELAKEVVRDTMVIIWKKQKPGTQC